MICLVCPSSRKLKCKALCKEMRSLLNKNTKSFSHRWTDPQVLEEILAEDAVLPFIIWGKSFRGWIYELYFLDKMSMEEIAVHLPLEIETIEDIIYQIKEDIDKVDNENKKIILREHLLNNSNITETHRITGFSKVYIYKIIREYIYFWGVGV